jgi:hypothetical protein
MKFFIYIYINVSIALIIRNTINTIKVNSLMKFSSESNIENKRDVTVLESIIIRKETGVKTRMVIL